MNLLIDVEKSVKDKVVDLFINPPASSPISASYNVYAEDEFFDDGFKPNNPFIWILGTRVPPKQTRLPLVMIDRAPTIESPVELGNRAGTFFTFNLHVFGRNRGERGSFAAHLYKNFLTLPIYSYAAPKTLVETVEIIHRTSANQTIAPEVGAEGSLSNWEVVSIEFQTMQ